MAIDPGTATLIATGANILSGAFGGNGSGTVNLNMRRERNQRRGLYALENENIGNRLKASVQGAKAAGLHPLFALGSGGGNSTQQFSMPGQAPTGNFASKGLQSLATGFYRIAEMQAKTDLLEEMNRTQSLKQADHEISNDTAFALSQGVTDPRAQELEKGKVTAHNPKNREQSRNILSPMTQFRIGSQNVWLPIEEMDQLMEDPAVVVAAAATYHGNKNIDWPLFWQEYRHGTAATPSQVTKGTKRMLKRIEKARKRRTPTRGMLEPGRRGAGPQPYRPKTWR